MIKYIANLVSNTTEQLILTWANYTVDSGYLGLTNNVWDLLVVGSYQFEPPAIRVKDKTFIVLDKNDSNNNKPYIVVYDHFRNKMTEPIDIGLTNDYGDIHNRPSISSIGDKIYITVSERGGPNPIKTKGSFSASNYDVRNFEAWTTLSTYRHEYPKMRLMNDGKLYSLQRYAVLTDASIISIDSTTTATVEKRVISTAVDPVLDIRPYVSDVKSYSEVDRKSVYRAFINRVENYRAKQQYLLYLESDDFITWYNADRSYSHNVDTLGVITTNILINNYTALKLPTENVGFIRCKYGIYTNSGNIYGLGGIDDNNNYGIIKYDNITKLWSTKQIIVSGFVFAKSFESTGYKWSNSAVIMHNGSFFTIYIQVIVNGFTKAAEFQSNDAETWTFIRYLSDTLTAYNNFSIMVNYSDTKNISESLLMFTDVSDSGIIRDISVENI